MKNKKREPKTDTINIRLSSSQKEKIKQNAAACGMNISQYLIHLDNHKNIVLIKEGETLAREIFKLNKTLERCESYFNRTEANKIRDILSQSIIKFNNIMKGLD